MHLQSVYPTAGQMGGAGRFGYSPQAHLTESTPLVSPETRESLLASWTPYWDLSRPILLEKSPPNLLKTRFLQALFPASYFVVVIRHPAVIAYATARWNRRGTRTWKNPPHAQIEHWLTCHETLEADASHVRRLILTRYENLVTSPDQELSRLWRFLGLSPTATVHEAKHGLDDKYFNRWALPWNPVKYAYKRGVTKRLEPRVRRWGYSLTTAAPTHGAEASVLSTSPARTQSYA